MSLVSSIIPLGFSVGENLVAPFPYQVLLDKVQYFNDEAVATGYAYIPPGSNSTIIQIFNSQNQLIDTTVANYSDTTNRFSFLLNLTPLANTSYTIQVSTGVPPQPIVSIAIDSSDSPRWVAQGSSSVAQTRGL